MSRRIMICDGCGGKIPLPKVPVKIKHKCPQCGKKNDLYDNENTGREILLLVLRVLPGFCFIFAVPLMNLMTIFPALLVSLVMGGVMMIVINYIATRIAYPADGGEGIQYPSAPANKEDFTDDGMNERK